MYKDNPDVSWKLNDLLEATKKAKSFAEDSLSTDGNKNFSLTDYRAQSSAPEKKDLDCHDNKSDGASLEVRVQQKNDNVIKEENEVIEEIEVAKKEMASEGIADKILEHAKEKEKIKKESLKEGYNRGYKEGEEKAKKEFQEFERDFNDLLMKIENQAAESDQLFEPLKKLSTAIAVQLVRGELSISSLAVDRLIKGSLSELDNSEKSNFLIYVSEFDMNQIEKFGGRFDNSLLRTDSQLSKGSVRLSMGDTVIEDFIETRLAEMSEIIFNHVEEDREFSSVDNEKETETFPESNESSKILEAEIIEPENNTI